MTGWFGLLPNHLRSSLEIMTVQSLTEESHSVLNSPVTRAWNLGKSWPHETSARAWCTGKTQRDRVEREGGGGIGMGNTCKSMADSCQCMTKTNRAFFLASGRPGFDPWVGKIPWRRNGNTLQYSCLESSIDKPGGLQSTGSQRVRHD